MNGNCHRCGGALEAGFLVDRGDYSVQEQAQWASGTPAGGFWRTSAVQKGERLLRVVTYRCTSCGGLDSFATEPA